MASLTGPFFGVEAFLNGSGMNPNEDQEFLQNINPQPIDPLNRNQFDPNAFGLQTQVNDDTFSPRPGTSLQDMLTQRELQANPGEPNFINAPQDFYQENPIENLGFIDPSTVPTEAIYDESMANALPGYNYNRFPNFNKNPTRFQNFKDGFGDIKDNFQDGFENFQDTVGDGFENVQDIIGTGVDKFKSGLGSIKDFAINKGNMGRNLLGGAGAMAMGLPGMVGSGLMSLLSNLRDPNAPSYQTRSPNIDYSKLNTNNLNDFYDDNQLSDTYDTTRFDRAKKGSFGSYRTLKDYFNRNKSIVDTGKKAAIENKKARDRKAAAEDAAAAKKQYSGPVTYNYDPKQGGGGRPDMSGRGKRSGFTNPGKGSYGPWKADGGIINLIKR